MREAVLRSRRAVHLVSQRRSTQFSLNLVGPLGAMPRSLGLKHGFQSKSKQRVMVPENVIFEVISNYYVSKILL